MTTPRPSLLDLHPVEALLALLLISAAALHRLVTDPPRPLRRPVPAWFASPQRAAAIADYHARYRRPIRQPQASADWKRQPLVRVTGIEPRFSVSYGALTIEERTACAVAARSAAEQVAQQLRRVGGIQLQANAAPGPTVAELRTMARQRGILSAGSRPIHKARRADLLNALGL